MVAPFTEMPNCLACCTSSKTSATRRIDLAGMHASFRQRPPTLFFSTTAVFMPSWAARIAATYPPGPDPTTMQSYFDSGMRGRTLADARHEVPLEPLAHIVGQRLCLARRVVVPHERAPAFRDEAVV